MVQVIGWTPSSQGYEPDTTSLNQFIAIFDASKKDDEDCPQARSGHRCFTDNDYFYVIGGYTHSIRRGSIFKELWAMSLATFEWRRYEIKGDLPETLASFALVQVFPYSKTFILFGGSGTDFGSTSSNDLYFVRINNDECSIESQKLIIEGAVPQPVYGHAMCAGEIPGKYYIIGGTEGVLFNFNVHSLTMKANPEPKNDNDKFTWHCELVSDNLGFSGRYRLEATYDENKHSLLFFGGGNTIEVFGFEKMVTLDLQTRVSSEVNTIPDSEYGFPASRRCHTLVRRGKTVIMTGGVDTTVEIPVHSDVWIFNLENYSWRKYEQSLPKSVFFHDAVVTEDGWMLLFGGVHGTEVRSPRNNVLHSVWFDVPPLQRFALESLRNSYPSLFSGLYCGNLRPSQVFEVFNVFCKEGRIEEKERQIIENGQIKFHESEDRSRYYLNTNSQDFVVRHQMDVDRNRRRRRRRNRIPAAENEPLAGENQGLQNVQRRLQEILGVLFNHMGVEEEDDEEDGDSGEESDNEDDFGGPDIDDDDFENGRFELIPQRGNWRPQE